MTPSEALGTGLGLAITSRLVKQMGGDIGCQSTPGAGSIFWIEIPLVLAEAPEIVREEPGHGVLPPANAQSLRILVVDDVKTNRDIAGALLSNMGHEVISATSGFEALERLPSGRFDLVLMDLQMPQMDGFATARAIRDMPAPLDQIPIFALTASVMPEQIKAAHEAGMNGHIGKPLGRETLAAALAGLQSSLPYVPFDAKEGAHESAAQEQSVLERRVLDLLKSELKGAAAGVIREFMVEMQMICDQFSIELTQEHPRPDVIAQNAHRLLGAARTLGAIQLCARLTAFQKSIAPDRTGFSKENAVALTHVIAETDKALQQLEIFFQAKLVGAETIA